MQAHTSLKTIWKINRDLWTKMVPSAWNNLPLDEKLAWIMIATYTFCVLTLIEMLVLK